MLKPTAAVGDDDHHATPVNASPGAGVSRRSMLTASAALAGAGLASVATLAFGQQPPNLPTSDQIRGPFYPSRLPADQDADLTVIAGQSASALGQVVYLSGRVIDMRGRPVANAEIEIWQANAAGRYTHPADRNPAALDPNFEGYAKIRAGADGRYSLKTVKPGAYPTPRPGWTRPPHIHFDIAGHASRLTTQMYFEGEALNDTDPLLQQIWLKETLIARRGAPAGGQESDALAMVWDIVLIAG